MRAINKNMQLKENVPRSGQYFPNKLTEQMNKQLYTQQFSQKYRTKIDRLNSNFSATTQRHTVEMESDM